LNVISGVVKLVLTTCAGQTAPDSCHLDHGNYSGIYQTVVFRPQ